MALWVDDSTLWEYRVPNAAKVSKAVLVGVMDGSGNESERPKIIISDHPDNEGHSVFESSATEHCIDGISASMDVSREDIDWYIQDSSGKIQPLSLRTYTEKITDPRYEELVQNNEFADHAEAIRAKKYFPDIEVERLQAVPTDITPAQQEQLDDALLQARANREIHQAIMVEQDASRSIPKSGHEYDLSQESFSR